MLTIETPIKAEKPVRLRDRMRSWMEGRNYSPKTIDRYITICRDFARFHNRAPEEMGEPDIAAYLTYLAIERGVAWKTQHQAMLC